MKALVVRFRAYLHKLAYFYRQDWVYFVQQYKIHGAKLANRITETRLLFSVFPGPIFLLGAGNDVIGWFCFVLFVAVALTDKVDGYLARKLDQVTSFGKMLDPAVDKVLGFITMACMLFVYQSMFWLILPVILIEIVESYLVLMAKHNGVPVAATKLGKARMAIQCAATAFLFIPINLEGADTWRLWAMVISLTIGLCSLIGYIWKFFVKRM